eukprot:7493-Heterococcus_DN1.PRE.3
MLVTGPDKGRTGRMIGQEIVASRGGATSKKAVIKLNNTLGGIPVWSCVIAEVAQLRSSSHAPCMHACANMRCSNNIGSSSNRLRYLNELLHSIAQLCYITLAQKLRERLQHRWLLYSIKAHKKLTSDTSTCHAFERCHKLMCMTVHQLELATKAPCKQGLQALLNYG